MLGQSKCSLSRWPCSCPFSHVSHHRLPVYIIVISVLPSSSPRPSAPSRWDFIHVWVLPCARDGARWPCKWSAAAYEVNEWSEVRPWGKFPGLQTVSQQTRDERMCDGKRDGWGYGEVWIQALRAKEVQRTFEQKFLTFLDPGPLGAAHVNNKRVLRKTHITLISILHMIQEFHRPRGPSPDLPSEPWVPSQMEYLPVLWPDRYWPSLSLTPSGLNSLSVRLGILHTTNISPC